MTDSKKINLADLNQDKKLKDLLEFPCSFTFKVVGANRACLVDDVVKTVQAVVKADYRPTQQASSKGSYNSVSITLNAENIEQIEKLYADLAKIDGVRMVL